VSTGPLQIEAPFTVGAQLEARAQHPEVGERVVLRHDERSWTYRQLRDEAVRYAHFLRQRLDLAGQAPEGRVAMLLENHLELLALYAGCGYAGVTLFGVNTGLAGDTLAGVLDQSQARLLVVDEGLLERVESVQGRLKHLLPENILVLPTRGGGSLARGRILEECLSREVARPGESLKAPSVSVGPETNLMVIYTSGTTGLPKGINNNHFKLLAIGHTVSKQLGLGVEDCGYACMPLFHSNAMFLGFQPAFSVGASLGLRERFSASRFVPDVLRYGVSYWNYVGEPVHYILAAIEKQHAGDRDAIRRQVTEHPQNRLRWTIGNGASPPDIDRFIDWLGLDDMYELYGSTEAAISTFRRQGDPRGSVGEVLDAAVRILDEQGGECPPAEIGGDGKILNYARAVGEICRVAADTALFQGYFENEGANSKKYRDGVYHSGDLGHILLRDGKRYLFFDGRTDDWIRKDGENFSAAQVARIVSEHPSVVLAAAYGVPCAVSDELVMVSIELAPGAAFDPSDFFDYCERQCRDGSMDRKWFPDFVRIVPGFDYTETQKILVRNLKQQHFDLRGIVDQPIFWRERGDTAYRAFSQRDFDRLRESFRAAEREDLLDR
jgi:fatty-acyl-CoA synthase